METILKTLAIIFVPVAIYNVVLHIAQNRRGRYTKVKDCYNPPPPGTEPGLPPAPVYVPLVTPGGHGGRRACSTDNRQSSIDIKTLFIDIDGCIVNHCGTSETGYLLPGVAKAFLDWTVKGYKIILTTGRRESQREDTVLMLRRLGIEYDLLVMGLPRGPRVVINDAKPDSDLITAESVVLVRNAGMENLEL